MSPTHPLDTAFDYCAQNGEYDAPCWLSEECLETTLKALGASRLRGDLFSLVEAVNMWLVWLDEYHWRSHVVEMCRREYDQASVGQQGSPLSCPEVTSWEHLMRCTAKVGEVAHEWTQEAELEREKGALISAEELDPDGLPTDVRKVVQLATLLLSWIAYILNDENKKELS